MNTKLNLPKVTELTPRLTVVGVGGAGCNAVNNMIATGLTGVDFVVANTDAQALASSTAEHRLQLGATLTEGLGAGSRPEIGEAAAEEAVEDIRSIVIGSHMVFIAAGMGGGTGTGAAAVIARVAREMGILVVGIVTKPFMFEGARRLRVAEAGIAELKGFVDTLIVIPNQNLFRVASEKTTFAEAFVLADQVLYSGISCIVDLIIKEGLINLDFADVRTVLSGMGNAMMGTGEASGEGRATLAAEEAIANPLLDDVSLKGARGLLLSITGGNNLTLYEVDEAASRVREEVDMDCNIIVGATFDEKLADRVRVSIVASGMARRDEGRSGIEAAESQRRRARAAEPTELAAPVDAGAEAAHTAQDVRRRLSDALQMEADTQLEAAGRGEPWSGPGNVVIQEAPPQLSATSYQPPPLPPLGGPAPARQSTPGGFIPSAPAEMRRRVPGIDEFPPIGQRAYRAAAPQPGGAPETGESPRRRGLFGRLADRVRGEADAAADAPPQGRPEPRLTGAGGGRNGPGTKPSVEHNGIIDPTDLPVFFNRDRR